MIMNLTVMCPRCEWPVLLIAGGTMKRLPTGALALLCPRCEESSSAKTLTGQVRREETP